MIIIRGAKCKWTQRKTFPTPIHCEEKNEESFVQENTKKNKTKKGLKQISGLRQNFFVIFSGLFCRSLKFDIDVF